MFHDPITAKQLAEAHLDELRRRAALDRDARAARREASSGTRPIRLVRRALGGGLVRAGARLMGEGEA